MSEVIKHLQMLERQLVTINHIIKDLKFQQTKVQDVELGAEIEHSISELKNRILDIGTCTSYGIIDHSFDSATSEEKPTLSHLGTVFEAIAEGA